jgi:ABC-2 type transport system permease protein
MTTNAIHDFQAPGSQPRDASIESQAGTLAALPSARRFFWAVRRELWEFRSIYLAPLGAGALFFFAFALSSIHFPQKMREAMALDPMKQHAAIATPYDMVAGLMMLTMMIIGAFYCLDALYGERRDRSTLFWKSMPVSDTMTVLAKASIPFIVLPLIVFAVGMVTELLMLALSSTELAISGVGIAPLWTHLSLPRMLVLLLYHLFMAHVLWHAPFYAWFLLVGAWVQRSPFLWAFLPPVLLCFVEKIVFNSTHFLGMLDYRLSGNGMDVLMTHGTFPIDPMTHMTPLRYLGSPGLWFGVALTAIFLAAAIRLRRERGPI